MSTPPTSSPTNAKPVSHEGGSIKAIVPPHEPNPKFDNVFVVSGNGVVTSFGYDFKRSCGCSATTAAVVTILKVDPGKKICWVATLPSGSNPSAFLVVSFFHAAFCTAVLPVASSAGLYVGFEYMPKMSPFLGLRTTAAPSRPASAFAITRCSAGCNVSVTLSAALVGAKSCSKLCGGCECDERKLLYSASSAHVPYDEETNPTTPAVSAPRG